MAETALNFGPEWLRALSHGNTAPAAPVSPEASTSKYKLADHRYGREEMLALFSKDLKVPEVLKQFDFLLAEKCQFPMALLPITEEEQRLWARSVNSDVALRVSGKGPTGPGNGMLRGRGGGSIDRGRARGRGGTGYYQRGLAYDENDDGPPGGFTRLRTLERSQSANEKDQRWDDRDRRLDRPFPGRSGILEDGHAKQDSLRPPSDNWRRNDKDDDNGGWRTANSRVGDKFAGRTTWRVTSDRDRMRPEFDSKEKGLLGRDLIPNGPGKTNSHHPRQRTSSGHFWDEDMAGDNLPEWSVEEPAVTDVVGTFDSSGAFLETKVVENFNSDDIYASDDEDCVKKKESPEPKAEPKPKAEPEEAKVIEKPPVETKKPDVIVREKAFDKPLKQSPKLLYIDKPTEPQVLLTNVSQTAKPSMCRNSELCTGKEVHRKTVVSGMPAQTEDVPGPAEEDAFAHHKKATENMMAQWTEEEEQSVASEATDKTVLPVHHEDAQKWFYRDPQAEIQGPFTSAEMYDWFKAGYFTLDLMVRRGCDERFTQLGELMQTWGRIPFLPGACPPPLRVAPAQTVPAPAPLIQAAPAAAAPNPTPTSQPAAQIPQPSSEAQLRLMQQQIYQQIMQQQILLRQAQMQQLLVQLKQQDSFTKLNSQQQMQAVQQLLAQQQQPQVARANVGSVPEQPILEPVAPPAAFPVMGLTLPPMMKNDMSLWNIPPTSGSWPAGQSISHPPGSSIWDADAPIPLAVDQSELEKQKKLAAEEEEKRRQAAEAVKKLEEEKRRREEEEKAQKEKAERLLREIQRQQEEEKRRLEEMKRLKEEEEKRRQEELKRLEEMKREEERRLEEIKRQEEKRLEELRKQEELRKLEEKQLEEQRKKELKRMEELRKIEEKKQEELQRKLEEQERQLEIERQKEAQRQKEQQQALELKLQKDAERQQELQRRLMAEKQRKEAEKALELQQKREAESKGPAWGVQNSEQPSGELSLSDIQKLQEKKEREEKEKMRQQQQYQQQLLLQQQSLKQAQANKNGLSWAKRPTDSGSTVKSLAEIQQEEAQKLAQHQLKVQKAASPAVQAPAISGVWGNSSQLSRITAPPAWHVSNSGFWDDALKSTTPAQKPTKNSESAFPALSNSAKPAVPNSNKNKNVRAKKDEDAVLKLFETHRKPTDEFTSWCTETLSSLPSSVDVPTFVAFLKDVESPYEVFDYVRSYLGEGKEAKEFGKQFLERRSKFRNQAKQAATEENMWGPAPAITPVVKPASVSDSDGTTCTKGKAKKKKNRMQKLDGSMLGFTVQPNPDRINVGEIDRVEGM